MNYKGTYDGSTNYAVGDVAVYTDGVPYVMHTDAPAGTPCHNVLYWERVPSPLSDAVVMFHGAFSAVPKNIDDEGITLKTDDGEYLVTVDDSGDTPELAVTKIEEESEEEAET